MMKKILLKVAGMHCPSCETITKEELGELSGVSNILVDAKAGSAELILDDSKNNVAEVIEAVKKAGYQAEVVSEKELKDEVGAEEKNKDIIVSTKYSKSTDPLRVKLETRTTAEFTIPENHPDIEKIVGQLGKTISV